MSEPSAPKPALWPRLREFLARLFRRAPQQPGRFEPGSKFSWHGWVSIAPWVLPSRDYLVYVPRGHARWRRRPLLVLLHGCRQTPEEFAAGTRIAAFADEHDWLVLLPRQARAFRRPHHREQLRVRAPAIAVFPAQRRSIDMRDLSQSA